MGDDKKNRDTEPGKAKALLGKSHNASVRSVQLAGFVKPDAGSAAGRSSQRIGESPRIRALAAVKDLEGFVPKPADVLLLKDLARDKPDGLQARLGALSAEELGRFLALVQRLVGEDNKLVPWLKKRLEQKSGDDGWMK